MRKPFYIALILGLAVSLFAAPVFSEETEDKEAASTFVLDWLSLVDNGSYLQTWEYLSDIFKSALTKDRWVDDLNDNRKPLGKLIKREQQHVTASSDASVGDYLIFQYQSSFEKKTSANETVSVIKDRDGNWKILGYGLF